MAESATVHMRPEWQEWNFVSPGGQMVAEAATARMRSGWQDWHLVSTGEGRRWRKPPPPACGQSGRSGPS